jgi:hypothetical protein
MKARIEIPKETLADFCRRNHIRRLAFFGSVLRDDFTPKSDVDMLVEFEPGTRIGLIGLAGVENEMSRLVGRKVDLNTAGCLSPYFRDEVLKDAEVAYEQA